MTEIKRTTIVLTPELYEQVRSYAFAMHSGMSKVIRDALELYMRRVKEEHELAT